MFFLKQDDILFSCKDEERDSDFCIALNLVVEVKRRRWQYEDGLGL